MSVDYSRIEELIIQDGLDKGRLKPEFIELADESGMVTARQVGGLVLHCAEFEHSLRNIYCEENENTISERVNIFMLRTVGKRVCEIALDVGFDDGEAYELGELVGIELVKTHKELTAKRHAE